MALNRNTNGNNIPRGETIAKVKIFLLLILSLFLIFIIFSNPENQVLIKYLEQGVISKQWSVEEDTESLIP